MLRVGDIVELDLGFPEGSEAGLVRGGAAHRHISVSELARYQAESSRRTGLAELAAGIDENTPPDEVITTR